MPFTSQGLQINRGTSTANAQGASVSIEHSYLSTDTLATITTPGYFPPNFVIADSGSPNILPQTSADERKIIDTLFIRSSDDAALVIIQTLNPVTLSADLFGAAASISIGAPIAATDNNALVSSGVQLKAQFADATHNGVVSTVDQDFFGSKNFLSGVKTNALEQFTGNNLTIGSNTLTEIWFGGTTIAFDTLGGSLLLLLCLTRLN
jgi:hypothetical protein